MMCFVNDSFSYANIGELNLSISRGLADVRPFDHVNSARIHEINPSHSISCWQWDFV
jgi:hypothetical protein